MGLLQSQRRSLAPYEGLLLDVKETPNTYEIQIDVCMINTTHVHMIDLSNCYIFAFLLLLATGTWCQKGGRGSQNAEQSAHYPH